MRIFLSIVAIMGLFTCQLDVKTAFLNATLEEEIYCHPVPDQERLLTQLYHRLSDGWKKSRVAEQIRGLRRGGVMLIRKAIYGLKQAPRQWWKRLHTFLRSLGFVPNKSDICLYSLHLSGGAFVLLLLYVDDILLAGSTPEVVDKYTQIIAGEFLVSAEGVLSHYLGFDIAVDRAAHRVTLSMTGFVERIFKRFKLAPKQSVDTPLQEGCLAALDLAEPADDQFAEDFEYRSKVGCILYYMICMRPDICFAVGLVARYSNKVSRTAAACVTRLLQYCYNTREKTLVLGGPAAYICGFCDSDWAGDRLTRRSTGAYILYLGVGAVEWGSRQHSLTAQSTAEAEYITMNAPARSILWLRWLLKQTGVAALITKYSSTLFTDSTSAQAIAENPLQSERTKHIAIKYHFIRELIEAGVISTEHVDTLLNVADIGTKALGKRKFTPFADMALGHTDLVRPTKRRLTILSDEFV